MLELTLRNRVPNAVISTRTGITVAVESIAHIEWN